MKNRALYSLIPLAVLFGCSHFHRDSDDAKESGTKGSASSYKCFEKEKCRVTVVVTACSAAGITTSPYILKVTRKLRDVPIVWTLKAPAGFSFAADGVHFKNKDMASKQFASPKASSHEFVWQDANTAPGSFPYNVRVRQGATDCPILDPIVINDDTDSP